MDKVHPVASAALVSSLVGEQLTTLRIHSRWTQFGYLGSEILCNFCLI